MAKRRPWTDKEDSIIRAHYPEHGQLWDGWSLFLPGRSTAALQKRASVLGVKCTAIGLRKTQWTTDEDEAIRKHYPVHGTAWDGWSRHLPGRSAKQIAWRAGKLGVRYLFAPKRVEGDGESKAKSGTKQKTAKKPHDEPTFAPFLGFKDTTWTDEQRETLLRHMVACVSETGHPVGECLVETARIITEGSGQE